MALGIIGFLGFLTCIVILIVSLVKKKKDAKLWGIGIAVCFVMFVIGAINSAPQEDLSSAADKTINKTVETKNVSTKQWAEQTIDKDSITEVTKSITQVGALNINSGDFKSININDSDNGLKNIVLSFKPTALWDEKDILVKAAVTLTSYSEIIFKNPKVNNLTVKIVGDFTDAYGKNSEADAVTITWGKETASKVDYTNFKDMVLIDYAKAFNIADAYRIHGAIYKTLKSKDIPIYK